MAIYSGNNKKTKIFFGNQEVQKIYFGNVLKYQVSNGVEYALRDSAATAGENSGHSIPANGDVVTYSLNFTSNNQSFSSISFRYGLKNPDSENPIPGIFISYDDLEVAFLRPLSKESTYLAEAYKIIACEEFSNSNFDYFYKQRCNLEDIEFDPIVRITNQIYLYGNSTVPSVVISKNFNTISSIKLSVWMSYDGGITKNVLLIDNYSFSDSQIFPLSDNVSFLTTNILRQQSSYTFILELTNTNQYGQIRPSSTKMLIHSSGYYDYQTITFGIDANTGKVTSNLGNSLGSWKVTDASSEAKGLNVMFYQYNESSWNTEDNPNEDPVLLNRAIPKNGTYNLKVEVTPKDMGENKFCFYENESDTAFTKTVTFVQQHGESDTIFLTTNDTSVTNMTLTFKRTTTSNGTLYIKDENGTILQTLSLNSSDTVSYTFDYDKTYRLFSTTPFITTGTVSSKIIRYWFCFGTSYYGDYTISDAAGSSYTSMSILGDPIYGMSSGCWNFWLANNVKYYGKIVDASTNIKVALSTVKVFKKNFQIASGCYNMLATAGLSTDTSSGNYFLHDAGDTIANYPDAAAGTSKSTKTYTIYTDNATIKQHYQDLNLSYTTFVFKHLDGTSWS